MLQRNAAENKVIADVSVCGWPTRVMSDDVREEEELRPPILLPSAISPAGVGPTQKR